MSDRDRKIKQLLDEGKSRAAIARELCTDWNTVARIAGQVGHPSRPRRPSGVDWPAVQAFYEAGHTRAQTERRFSIRSSSWSAAVARGDLTPVPAATNGAPRNETRGRVAALLAEGCSYTEIAERLGVSQPTIAFHARRLGIPAKRGAAKRYDWEAISAY